MENFQLFGKIKQIHGAIAPITFLLVILSDLYGFLWIIGKIKHLKMTVLVWLHRIVFFGLGALIATGLTMLILNNVFLTNYIFYIKMFFVAVLFWNAFRIGEELKIPAKKTFKETSVEEKKKIFVVGITSFVSWVCALILAGML